jgi:hypothetical protein
MNLMNNEYHHTSIVNSMPATPLGEGGAPLSLSSMDLSNYMDGTKSLPSKKKRKFFSIFTPSFGLF